MKLKECPFCGGIGIIDDHWEDDLNNGDQIRVYRVGCPVCQIWAPSVQAWNKRHEDVITLPPPLTAKQRRARNKSLEEFDKRLKNLSDMLGSINSPGWEDNIDKDTLSDGGRFRGTGYDNKGDDDLPPIGSSSRGGTN
jgi:hypothetical protein